MYDLLNRILKSLMSGSLSELNPQNIVAVSNEAVRIIEKTMPLNEYDVNNASMIISISQIVYNNTDRTVLFLDDGVYDILLEKYKVYNSSFQVGAPEIVFNQDGEAVKEEYINPMEFVDNIEEFREQCLALPYVTEDIVYSIMIYLNRLQWIQEFYKILIEILE